MGAYLFLLPVGPSRENQLRATLGSASISRPRLYYDVLRADHRESVPARFGPVALDNKRAVGTKVLE